MTSDNGNRASRLAQRLRTKGRGAGATTAATSVAMKPGLSIWSGLIQEEYLGELAPWSKEVKIFKEMQDDVVIGALFESVRTPLLSSPFEISAGGDSPEDERARAFLEENILHNPNFEWISHVEEMLQFIELGFAVSEKVLEKDKKDGLLHIRDLMPIGQDSLDRWGEPDELGRVTSFQQRDKRGTIHTAPMEKLLHFAFRSKKRNPQGQGLLRALYRPWYFKKNLETLEAIGIERDVGNAPVVKLKENVRYSTQDIDDLKEALEGFRMDEALYVILPSGAELTAYGGGNKVYDVRATITAWQHLIRQRFFADFLAFGSSAVGTQALAREMTTFFGLALRSIQQSMLAVWNRQLVPWLFKWNNWELEHLPTIDWLRPGESNIQSLVQAYNMLVSSGLMDVNDPEFRARVRSQIGLRPSTTPDKEVVQNIKTPGQLGQQKQVGQIKAGEGVDFSEMSASEALDALLGFFDTVVNLVTKGQLGGLDGVTQIVHMETQAKPRLGERDQIVASQASTQAQSQVLRATKAARGEWVNPRPNFEDMEASDLVDTAVEFIMSLVTNALAGKQDIEVARGEIRNVQRDFLTMAKRSNLPSDDLITVLDTANDGVRVLEREVMKDIDLEREKRLMGFDDAEFANESDADVVRLLMQGMSDLISDLLAGKIFKIEAMIDNLKLDNKARRVLPRKEAGQVHLHSLSIDRQLRGMDDLP